MDEEDGLSMEMGSGEVEKGKSYNTCERAFGSGARGLRSFLESLGYATLPPPSLEASLFFF